MNAVSTVDVEHAHAAVVFLGILGSIKGFHERGGGPYQVRISDGNHVAGSLYQGFLDAQNPAGEIVQGFLDKHLGKGSPEAIFAGSEFGAIGVVAITPQQGAIFVSFQSDPFVIRAAVQLIKSSRTRVGLEFISPVSVLHGHTRIEVIDGVVGSVVDILSHA